MANGTKRQRLMNRRPPGRLVEVVIAVALTLAALAVLLARLSSAAEPAKAEISVTHAWARPSVGQLGTSAVYFRIDNTGAGADRLIGVSTQASASAELHQTSNEDGIMRMRHITDGVAVPAKRSVEFSPGGYHVMLTGLQNPLKKGDAFALKLRFEKAGEIDIPVVVAATPPGLGETHRSHH